eukprot:10362890-Lingulodinium_polyedra.AAC.1
MPPPAAPGGEGAARRDAQPGNDKVDQATAPPGSSAASSAPSEGTEPAPVLPVVGAKPPVDESKLRSCKQCGTKHHWKAMWGEK